MLRFMLGNILLLSVALAAFADSHNIPGQTLKLRVWKQGGVVFGRRGVSALCGIGEMRDALLRRISKG